MNILIMLFLFFAIIGLIDKNIGSKLGLTAAFDRGLMTMGGMAIPTISTCCVAVELIQRNINKIENITEPLPFDDSLIAGLLLAPDTGGYFIAKQLAENESFLILNGVIIAGLFGQTVSYQIPIFLSALEKQEHLAIMKGFVVGIVTIPIGLVITELFLKIPIVQFGWHFMPLLIICGIISVGLIKIPDKTVRLFSVFANGIQIVVNLMFIITIIGVFIPSIAYTELSSVEEALVIVFRATIVISGSMVLAELILKCFHTQIRGISQKLGVNEVSVVGMLMNFATSLAIIPLIPRMDEKGKMMNAAFSVSGAYVFGGQLGFVYSVADGQSTIVLVIVKIVCGLLSMFLMHKVFRRMA